MNKKQMKNLINIIQTFDWVKIYKVMEFLDWKWEMDNYDEYKIPTIGEIISFVISLVEEACENLKEANTDELTVSTGGFEITVFKNDDIIIKFIIEQNL